MLTKFRLKMVALNVVLVGVILIAVCFYSYQYSGKAVLTTYRDGFSSACRLFENIVTARQNLNYRDMYEFGQAHNLVLYVTDNGVDTKTPYPYDTAHYTELRQSAQTALDALKQEDTSEKTAAQWGRIRKEQDFTTIHDGEEYFSKYIAIPNTYGTWLEIMAIQSMNPYKSELFNTRIFYMLLTGIGFILISGLNYMLAKKAIQPAVAAQEAQREFIAAAGHELKSPLAVILSSADMLASDQEHYREYQSNIASEAQRMSRLVDDLLLLERLDLNRTEIECKSTDTEGLLLSTYEKFLPIAKDTAHTLELILPDAELHNIIADEQRIVQVLSILLTNAFNYTPKNTAVEIVAYEQHNTSYIAIVDHGAGIADKKRVFDKFYRSDRGRSQKEHFGLGLSIAAEIMRMHGSEVTLTDTAGGGATFTISLPFQRQPTR